MDIKVFTGDVEQLRPLVTIWQEEANTDDFGFNVDIDIILRHFKKLMEYEESDILVMESKAGRILGMMGVVVQPSMSDDSLILHEHIWYVVPEHRSSMSMKLMHLAEKVGIERGCKHFCMTASKMISNSHDVMCRLYSRTGFKLFETIFIKELKE